MIKKKQDSEKASVKGNQKKHYVDKLAEKLLPRLPDWMTGKTKVLEEKLYLRYGMKEFSDQIKKMKLCTLKKYLTVLGLMVLLLTAFGINELTAQSGAELKQDGKLLYLDRPELSKRTEQIALHVKMKHENTQLEKGVELKVKSRSFSQVEKEKLLRRYAHTLPSLILSDNESISRIETSLDLFDQSKENGITLVWHSDRPDIISDEGKVDGLSVKDKLPVTLTAELAYEDLSYIKKIPVTVVKSESKKVLEMIVTGRLDDLIDELESSQKGKRLLLPKQLEDEIYLSWKMQEGNAFIIILLFSAAIAAAVFQGRYQFIDREWKEARTSMLQDFPGLVNKLVLLLNAGLVVTSALAKIADDYSQYKTERRPLYEELCEIQRKARDTNLPVITGIKEFSGRSGMRQLMRFSAILAENMDKGVVLAEKLETEAELLWISRKKDAEEKGRLAETKLTLPLLILLITLIVITIAPAMMEM